MKKEDKGPVTVATNRKAFHDYHIIDTIEAGISLAGPEVKSLRNKQATAEGSFVRIEGDQAFVYNLRIAPYPYNNVQPLDPTRTRKLLLNKTEIVKLASKTNIKGNALVVLEIYFKHGWAKLKLGLATGKQASDKRDTIKRKELSREMQRDFKNKYKG